MRSREVFFVVETSYVFFVFFIKAFQADAGAVKRRLLSSREGREYEINHKKKEGGNVGKKLEE